MTYHDRVVATSPQQWTRATIYAALLLCLNLYICRLLFSVPTAHMNSMQGFWIALAGRADGSWWHPSWWPNWDNGIPFEFTYAPLVPALTAIISSIRGVSGILAFQTVTALAYSLIPVTLFFAAWRITRAAGYSFAAAMFYSLTAPTQILIPDETFRWSGFWDSRRFFLASYWDETPHLLALVFLPLMFLFLTRAMETGHRRYYAAAALSIAIATYASAFGPTIAVMIALCLLFTLRVKDYPRNLAIVVSIGALGYALAAAFLPPSVILAMHRSSTNPWRFEPGWTVGSLTALAIVALGWTVLRLFLPRWTNDWKLQFFAYFAWLASSIPLIAAYLHRQFLPQPVRYKFEMEIAVALLVVFGLRTRFEKLHPPVKCAIIFLLLALALEQVAHYRADARIYVAPADLATTVESRASLWSAQNLPGVRVALPGSIAQWANAVTDVSQLSGGSWSMAYNPVQQRGLEAFYSGDARISLAWLRAFGNGAVAVSAPNSQEYWKSDAHPAKFEGLLPSLWSEAGVTIYRIPQRSATLAHVIPEAALIAKALSRIDDITGLERYDAALDDASLPLADMQWEGRNRIRIHTTASDGQLVSVQVSYHPGWHASVNGRHTPLHSDGLGLLWLRPACQGECEIQLDYDGGLELRFCRYLTVAAFLVLIALFLWPARRVEAV